MPVKKKSPAQSRSTKSTKTKSSASKAKKPAKVAKDELTLDRRGSDRRDEQSSETTDASSAPVLERRKKVQRRRQIDPTTCERDYSPVEVEFMSAMDDYKRTSGRMFPTCSEVLEVIGLLGYVKLTAAELTARTPQEMDPSEVVEQTSSDEDATGWPAMEMANECAL